MAECHGCGASVEFGSYSCSYCGSLVGEQRDTRANEQVHGQLTNKFTKIETKLDELLVMPLPTYWHMIVTPFRWYVIIATLGIAAFFWRKPKQKETFDAKRFHALKTQIEREIAIIDAGAKSSPELKARLELFRSELKKITDRLFYGRILNMTPLLLIAVLVLVGNLGQS
jgi:hypothetical protein